MRLVVLELEQDEVRHFHARAATEPFGPRAELGAHDAREGDHRADERKARGALAAGAVAFEAPRTGTLMSGTVSGVSGSGRRYLDDEQKAIQKDASTSEIVNKGRRDAGPAGSKEKADVRAKNDSLESYKAALATVHSRDARYDAAHVTVRM